MHRSTITLLIISLISFLPGEAARAQSRTSSLQPGVPIENTLAAGQTQSFSINLDKDQFLQVTVEQHGIDVIVRVFSPAGKSLGEFDSPNGNEGPENVAVVSEVAGIYRIDVSPLGQVVDVAPGRYQIKILELRHATDEELQAGKNQEALKNRGLGLLVEVADSLAQIRSPQARVRAQVKTSQLLWPSNEKLAAKLMADAIEGVREFIASAETSDQDYYTTYSWATQLRREVLQVMATRDPEAALAFLRSTHALARPEGMGSSDWDQENQLELSLASQMIAKDPKRAFQIAEDSLKRGQPSGLLDVIIRLREHEPELAAQLARELAAKLIGESLLKNQEASSLAVSLLQQAHGPVWRSQRSADSSTQPKNVDLLSEQEFKDLFEKTLAEGLSYSAPPNAQYSLERNSAQTILTTMQTMNKEMATLAPASVAVVEKKIIELNTPADPESARLQKYQQAINTGTVDAGVEEVARAPREIRNQLYQQVAEKAASSGDLVRARQIIKDNISNPEQRRQVLSSLDQNAIYQEMSRGQVEAALRDISSLRNPNARAAILLQVVNQIGPGLKRAKAMDLLEQARNIIGATPRPENQEQMGAVIEIARAFSRYDSKQAFEILEPLLDQFNELSTAARTLDGFGQQFYVDGELSLQNGTSVANLANQLAGALGTLTPKNFDRAKAGADRFERQEVRIVAYLAIAQEAIGLEEDGRSGRRVFYRRY